MTKADGAEIFTSEDPVALFREWMDLARAKEPEDANAMALATADKSGLPDVRMVLLKDVDARGFVFYTNLESDKGCELAENSQAAICFHWKSLRRQVRVRGSVSPVSDEEADAYFATRARDSQIGAWASRQSRPLETRFELEREVAKFVAKFGIGAATAALVGVPDRPCTDRILARPAFPLARPAGFRARNRRCGMAHGTAFSLIHPSLSRNCQKTVTNQIERHSR